MDLYSLAQPTRIDLSRGGKISVQVCIGEARYEGGEK